MRINTYDEGTNEYALFEILAEIGEYGGFDRVPERLGNKANRLFRKMHGKHPSISIKELAAFGTLTVVFDCGTVDYSDDDASWPLDDWWLSEHKDWGAWAPGTFWINY